MKVVTFNLDLEGWVEVKRAQMSESRYGFSVGLTSALADSEDSVPVSPETQWLPHTPITLFTFCNFMLTSPLQKLLSLLFHIPAPLSWHKRCFPGNKLMGMEALGGVECLRRPVIPEFLTISHLQEDHLRRRYPSKVSQPGRCRFQEGGGRDQQTGELGDAPGRESKQLTLGFLS